MNIVEITKELIKNGKDTYIYRSSRPDDKVSFDAKKSLFYCYCSEQCFCIYCSHNGFGIPPADLIADDWEIFFEGLTFMDAMKVVSNGGKVTNPYIFPLYLKEEHGRIVLFREYLREGMCSLSLEDIFSNKWEKLN